MNSEITLFKNPEFGEVRTIIENDQPWFVAKDVAEILGYSKPRNAVSMHCKGALKQGILTDGGMQTMTIIPEPDLYRLIIKSTKPEAEQFEKWVMEEVLPSIRKHGGYIVNHDGETEEELMARAWEVAQRTLERRERRIKALEGEVLGREKVIAEMIPKVDYVDQILMSPDTVTMTQIAKDYDLTPQQLNKILHEERIQYKVDDQWVLYANQAGKGYTRSETINVSKKAGKDKFIMVTKWTQKGRLLIHEILKQRNISPYMEA